MTSSNRNPFAKPSATARKVAEQQERRGLISAENAAKAAARRRDRGCRFPCCGCRALRLRLEVAHHPHHKGSGGNPSGDRSTPAGLVLLCAHRHQHGAISLHKGTLRPRFLSSDGFAGPIAWLVDVNLLEDDSAWHLRKWREVARETRVGQWQWRTPQQQAILERLGEMDL